MISSLFLQQSIRTVIVKALSCLYSPFKGWRIPLGEAKIVLNDLKQCCESRCMPDEDSSEPKDDVPTVSPDQIIIDRTHIDEIMIDQTISDNLSLHTLGHDIQQLVNSKSTHDDEEDRYSEFGSSCRDSILARELERRIRLTEDWIERYDQLMCLTGVGKFEITETEEFDWSVAVDAIRESAQNIGAGDEDVGNDGVGTSSVGTLKKSCKSKGSSTSRRVIGSSLISEIFECPNLSLKINSILPDVLIHRLTDIFKFPQLRKGQFSLDLSSFQLT